MSARRLERSSRQRMIAGVAGGIAEYLEVDVTWVRLFFVILGFGGVGILAYLVLLILMPLPEPGGWDRTLTPEARWAHDVPRAGAQGLALTLDASAGTFRLAGGAAELVEVRTTGRELSAVVDRDDGTVKVRVAQDGVPLRMNATQADVRVAGDMPLDLRVIGNAGEYVLDLGDVTLRVADVEAYAANVDITLPHPQGEVAISLAGSATSIKLHTGGVEYRVISSGGLSSLSGPTESAGYARAADRVVVTLGSTLTSVQVVPEPGKTVAPDPVDVTMALSVPVASSGGGMRGEVVGVVLIVIGAVFLMGNFGLLRGIDWREVWPVTLIAFGLFLLAARMRR